MELTLSPNIEREAIQELRARQRDETVSAPRFKLVRIVARLVVHDPLHWLLNSLVDQMTRQVERRNDRIANHLRWFPRATDDLRSKVDETGVPAGEELGQALDDLVKQVDESTRRLIALIELLEPNSEFRVAVHRSARLLLEVKASAIEMKRAGRLEAPVHKVSRRVEIANAFLVSSHGRKLETGGIDRDPELLAQARKALKKLPQVPVSAE
jgi:hypothetical protein